MTAQQVCCFSSSVKRWQIKSLNNIFADFWRFPVVRTVIKNNLPPSSEFGEGMKFTTPMEAAIKQTLQSLPLDKRSKRDPARVKTPTRMAPTRTGRPISRAPARVGPLQAWARPQKHKTPAKWLMSVAIWNATAFRRSDFDSFVESGGTSPYRWGSYCQFAIQQIAGSAPESQDQWNRQ